MSQQPEQLQRTGRGGAGNFRRPSTDPENTSTAKGIIKDIKNTVLGSKEKTEYVHHGRGGAGNLSTTKDIVAPVQSMLNPKTELKPAKGRGGAGNLAAASEESASLDGRPGNVVTLPSEEAQQADVNVQEPQQAHLGQGREAVRDDGAIV